MKAKDKGTSIQTRAERACRTRKFKDMLQAEEETRRNSGGADSNEAQPGSSM